MVKSSTLSLTVQSGNPPPAFVVTVSPGTVSSGQRPLVSISGAAPGPLKITIQTEPTATHGISSMSAVADSTGAAAFYLDVSALSPGVQDVTVTDSKGDVAAVKFTVSAVSVFEILNTAYTVVQGSSFIWKVAGATPNGILAVTLGSMNLPRAITDAGGNASGTVQVPTNFPLGTAILLIQDVSSTLGPFPSVYATVVVETSLVTQQQGLSFSCVSGLDGSPIPNVSVKIVGPGGSPSLTAVSDSKGNVSFAGVIAVGIPGYLPLPQGTYVVQVTPPAPWVAFSESIYYSGQPLMTPLIFWTG